MYLKKVFAAFHKSGKMIIVKERLLVGLYKYIVEDMVDEVIKIGLHPPLTKDEIEIKPFYIIREGEKE